MNNGTVVAVVQRVGENYTLLKNNAQSGGLCFDKISSFR